MEEEKKSFEIDMVRGPVLKKMLLFSLPLMCSSILQLLFNAADIIVVGRFAGDNSLAAVGSNSALITLMTNLFIGFSVGANVTAARFYGARKQKDLKETVHTAMMLSVAGGLILTVIGQIGARRILIWMEAPAEVLDLATLYLRVYFLGMTGMMIYNFGSALLRAVGDTRRPLYFLAFSGVVNIGLNLFFVISLKMDVAGVGAATAISQWLSAGLIVRCLLREKTGIHLVLRDLRIYKDKLIAIVRIGLPAGVQGMIFSLTNVLVQASVNSFGAVIVAGNSAAANIESFIYFAMNAFYQATISFTSQNVGARRIKPVSIIGGPTARTVEIAGAGRIQKDSPRNVALVLLLYLQLFLRTKHAGIYDKVFKELSPDSLIAVSPQALCQFIPVAVLVFHIVFDHSYLRSQ